MRNVLVIVNYMRNNPTIVDDFVYYTNDHFSKIYIVNRNTNDLYPNINKYENVEILEIKRKNRILLLPVSCLMFFSKDRIKDIIFSIKKKVFSWKFILLFSKQIHVEELLYFIIKKIPEIKSCPSKVTLFSIWYTSEAYAIARVKSHHPQVKSISMAHAHEVESFDNKYTFIGKKYTQMNLDKVFFISQSKMDVFIKEVCKKRDMDISNLFLKYWGSKREDFEDEISDSDKIIIVSCSTVESLKRVHLIAESLALIENEIDFDWFHFGDGPEMQCLISKIKSLPVCQRKKMHLMGRVENIEVKNFYHCNQVDLFINVSTTEGLPISVMEAFSYGIPAIVTDVGGEKEIVDHKINGYLLDKNIDSQILMETILHHFQKSENDRQAMKIAAIDKWEDKFNLDHNIDEYLKELKD